MYVYDFWVRPYIVKHEAEIDNKLFELNLKVSKIGLLLREKAENYGQTWFVEILQHFWSARIHSDQVTVLFIYLWTVQCLRYTF